MTRRRRGVLIVGALALTLAGIELGFSAWKGSEACVQVENVGTEPIEGLVAVLGTERAGAARVEPGGSVRLFLAGDGEQTLQLRFRQRGNAISAYEVPGFDPGLMGREGSKLVVQIRPSEVVRFQDEAEASTPIGRTAESLWKRTRDALTAEY